MGGVEIWINLAAIFPQSFPSPRSAQTTILDIVIADLPFRDLLFSSNHTTRFTPVDPTSHKHAHASSRKINYSLSFCAPTIDPTQDNMRTFQIPPHNLKLQPIYQSSKNIFLPGTLTQAHRKTRISLICLTCILQISGNCRKLSL